MPVDQAYWSQSSATISSTDSSNSMSNSEPDSASDYETRANSPVSETSSCDKAPEELVQDLFDLTLDQNLTSSL